MSKNFNINGSLTINDINVKGNLNVQGTTNTVNQETLTVKDNLIAVNGGGAPLDTAGVAGVVAITGGEALYLKPGIYYLDNQKVIDVFEFSAYQAEIPSYGTYAPCGANISKVKEFNDNSFIIPGESKPLEIKIKPSDFSTCNGGIFILNLPNSTETQLAYIRDCFDLKDIITRELYVYPYDNVEISITEEVFVNNIGINYLKQLLITDQGNLIDDSNFTSKPEAYAAPVYDVASNSLKIGLGNYEKDESGDIISFTFASGQAQAIATRDEEISNSSLLAWSSSQNKIVGSNLIINDNIIYGGGENPSYLSLGGSSSPYSGGCLDLRSETTVQLTTYHKDGISIVPPNGSNSRQLLFPQPVDEEGNIINDEQTFATQEWVKEQGYGSGSGSALYKHIFSCYFTAVLADNIFYTVNAIIPYYSSNSTSIFGSPDEGKVDDGNAAQFLLKINELFSSYENSWIDGISGCIEKDNATYASPIVAMSRNGNNVWLINYIQDNVLQGANFTIENCVGIITEKIMEL